MYPCLPIHMHQAQSLFMARFNSIHCRVTGLMATAMREAAVTKHAFPPSVFSFLDPRSITRIGLCGWKRTYQRLNKKMTEQERKSSPLAVFSSPLLLYSCEVQVLK